MGPSEDDLVARARDGDTEAFAELVRRGHARIYRLVLRLTGNAADADEVCQDTFLRAHERLADFRGDATFATWTARIATNFALMRLRRAARRPTASLDDCLPHYDERGLHAADLLEVVPSDDGDDPEARLDRDALRELMLEGLAALPESYRVPFVLRDLEELSGPQVAEALDLTTANVRQRVHRARLMLRGWLARRLRGAR